MRRTIFKSKIHRARVTQADLDYEGSVTIDAALMEAANIASFEAVHIRNVTRGTRLVTHAIEGPRGSGTICINGAAAHLNQPAAAGGCSHLNELLSPMATAAFQTIAAARRDRGGPPSPDKLGVLLNSCYTLRESGEVVRQVRRGLRDHDADGVAASSDAPLDSE